jgi:hypothetical protein
VPTVTRYNGVFFPGGKKRLLFIGVKPVDFISHKKGFASFAFLQPSALKTHPEVVV